MRNFVFLSISSIIIFACIFQLARLSNRTFSEGITSPSGMETSEVELFSSFKVDHPFEVAFDFPELAEAEFSPREEANQMRDWIVHTLLCQSGVSDSLLNNLTFDLPPIRYSYLEPVSNLEYGPTRTRYTGYNTVLALVPVCDEKTTNDYLAHAADEHRKNQGEIPGTMFVFQYKLDVDAGKAIVKRLSDHACKDFYNEDAGYMEMRVNSLADLEQFLKKTDDLIYANHKSGSLVVGGRKISSRSYGKLTSEDVAAIWQSEQDIAERLARFENKWNNVTYDPYENGAKERLIKQMLLEQKELGIVDGSGFSLDPSYDFEGLQEKIKEYAFLLSSDFSSVAQGLRENDIVPLLIAIDKMSKNPSSILHATLLKQLEEDYRFQAARYDGKLQGTKVGMTLFYTDLIAKLWTQNFNNSTPFRQIPEFVADSKLKLPRVYEKESEAYPSDRLWFGPNENKFTFTDSKREVFFSRNASKIFSASSNPLEPGKEVNSSAFWSASVTWWNNHYEEVATYEPEYERLNEIMKWSTVISWLNSEQKGSMLNFLRNVKVERGLWFPDWAKNNQALRFDDWEEVGFYKKGYKGCKTEALPILYTPALNFSYISGGVSLASKSAIKEMPILNRSVNAAVRRPNFSIHNNRLTSVKGHHFEITAHAKEFKVLAHAPEEMKLRNYFSEVANQSIERKVYSSLGGTRMRVACEGLEAGELSIRTSSNGFSAGFKSRDMHLGLELSKKMSDVPNPVRFLEAEKAAGSVSDFYKISANQYLIRSTSAKRWLHIEVGADPSVTLPVKWSARTSGISSKSKICNMRWVEYEEAARLTGGKIQPLSLKPKPRSKVFKYLENGETSPIANQLRGKTSMKDMKAIKSEVDEFYKFKLNEVDELLKMNDNTFAVKQLDEMILIFGEKPALIARKGLVQVQEGLNRIGRSGPSRQSASMINDAILAPALRGDTKFYQQVVKMVKSSDQLSIADKKLLENFASHAAPGSKSRVFAAKTGDSEFLIMAGDNPSLSNLDWASRIKSSFRENMGIADEAINLREIPRQGASDFRFELGFGRLGSGSNQGLKLRGRYQGRNFSQVANSNCDDEDDDPFNDCTFYFLKEQQTEI